MVRWTQARAENIATRSYRYLDAIDIKVGWADEAARPGRQPVRSGAATRRHTMATRPETEIDRLLEPTANEYVDEERAAAEEESHDAAASAVFSVRLSPATYDAVRAVAAKGSLDSLCSHPAVGDPTRRGDRRHGRSGNSDRGPSARCGSSRQPRPADITPVALQADRLRTDRASVTGPWVTGQRRTGRPSW